MCKSKIPLHIYECVAFAERNLDNYRFPSHFHATKHIPNKNIQTKNFKTASQQKFMDYVGPDYYNIIFVNIRNISNLAIFKKQRKSCVIRNPQLFQK